MGRIVIPHILTQSMKVASIAQGAVIGGGTGFTCMDKDGAWLVTNRHVLLGRRPETNEYVDGNNRQPDRVAITWINDDLTSDEVTLDLFGEGLTELWIEHPPLAHNLDLVALPTPSQLSTQVDLFDALDDASAPVTSGDPVIIAGFPYGLSAGLDGLPIMFSGIVASPPGVQIDGKPRFLIDARTRPGLSGSPVYYYPNGASFREGSSNATHCPRPKFLGLYCGRTNEQSDLGYVIEAKEVARTLVHQRPGRLLP